MKGLKKVLTGILAGAMALSLTLSAGSAIKAYAAGNSITITHKVPDGATDKEITYNYYEIMKAEVDPNNSDNVAYYVESETVADALAGTGYFEYTEVSSTHYNVALAKTYSDAIKAGTTTKEAVGKAIGVALNTADFKKAAYSTGTFSNKVNGQITLTATSPELETGYYLVTSSLGSVVLVQTLGSVNIEEKNTFPGVKKEKATTPDIYAMFGIGSELKYSIDVEIPESVAEKDILVVDTATKGLTFPLTDAIAVTGGVSDFKLSWTKTNKTGTIGNKTGVIYEATIPAATVLANAGKTLTLTYSATLNEEAVVFEPEKNTAHIEYDNYKTAETEPVEVKTIAFKIRKYTIKNNKEEPLKGAEFTLWDAKKDGNKIAVVQKIDVNGNVIAGQYRVASADEIANKKTADYIVVDDNGSAQVDGLELTTYWLQEDKAPAGFNKLAGRVEVLIDENHAELTNIKIADVLNESGVVLPSTGGIGTTIFYIIGGLLIVAAVVFFVVRRKADAE